MPVGQIVAATERVVILMTPGQKASVASHAAAEKLSVGDYMRRNASGDDELLGALMVELAASTERAQTTLDRTLARPEEAERRLPEIEAAARERAMAEFADVDPDLLAQIKRESAA